MNLIAVSYSGCHKKSGGWEKPHTLKADQHFEMLKSCISYIKQTNDNDIIISTSDYQDPIPFNCKIVQDGPNLGWQRGAWHCIVQAVNYAKQNNYENLFYTDGDVLLDNPRAIQEQFARMKDFDYIGKLWCNERTLATRLFSIKPLELKQEDFRHTIVEECLFELLKNKRLCLDDPFQHYHDGGPEAFQKEYRRRIEWRNS